MELQTTFPTIYVRLTWHLGCDRRSSTAIVHLQWSRWRINCRRIEETSRSLFGRQQWHEEEFDENGRRLTLVMNKASRKLFENHEFLTATEVHEFHSGKELLIFVANYSTNPIKLIERQCVATTEDDSANVYKKGTTASKVSTLSIRIWRTPEQHSSKNMRKNHYNPSPSS